MAVVGAGRISGQEKVLVLCKVRAYTVEELAAIFMLSTNTIRAWYLYPLIKSGRLLRLSNPNKARGRLYKTVSK